MASSGLNWPDGPISDHTSYGRRIVMAFQSNKAPGYDKVRMSTVKEALPCIIPVLTDLVNRSLQSSIFLSA